MGKRIKIAQNGEELELRPDPHQLTHEMIRKENLSTYNFEKKEAAIQELTEELETWGFKPCVIRECLAEVARREKLQKREMFRDSARLWPKRQITRGLNGLFRLGNILNYRKDGKREIIRHATRGLQSRRA